MSSSSSSFGHRKKIVTGWWYPIHPSIQELAKDLILCNKYFDDYHILFPHIEYTIKTLWQDNGVRKAVARGFEYELNDSAL